MVFAEQKAQRKGTFLRKGRRRETEKIFLNISMLSSRNVADVFLFQALIVSAR